MAPQRAESISVRELSGKLTAAVQAALKKHPGFGDAKANISFLPDPGIIGFILRESALGEKRFSELSALAGDVTSQLPELAVKSQHAFLSRNGNIIVGFFPRAEMIEFKE